MPHLILAAAFLFSIISNLPAQTIKLKSLTPLPETETEVSSAPFTAKEPEGFFEVSDSEIAAPASTGTAAFKEMMARPAEPEPAKKSLKDFLPMKEGTLMLRPKKQQKNIKPKQSEDKARIKGGALPIQIPNAKESYSRKKTVHLKNFDPISENPAGAWKLKALPHFKLYYEAGAASLISSLSMYLEALYSNMRLKVDVFPTWTMSEPANIYLYATRQAYISGEFKPDKWSNGVAYPARRTIALPVQKDFLKLKSVCAHELTHVYFESFFSERKSRPPLWLNEGLAVFMESGVYSGNSDWDNALRNYPDKDFKLPDFFGMDLGALPEEMISYWYLQSFASVSFLLDYGNKLSFKNFCIRIAAGEKEENLLWTVYRFKDLAEFKQKFDDWIAAKSGSTNVDGLFDDFDTSHSDSDMQRDRNYRKYRFNNFRSNFKRK